MSELSLYDILGVPQIAERDEIITAYRRMAKLYHPDYAGDEGREMFEDVQRAYKCLSDEKSREMLGSIQERVPLSLSNLKLTRKQYYSRLHSLIICGLMTDKRKIYAYLLW